MNQGGQVVLSEQILQGLYTASISHLLIYIQSVGVMIVSINDSMLTRPGTNNSTSIVLTDAMT